MTISILAWVFYFVSCYYLQSLITQVSSYNVTVSHKSFLGLVGLIYITCVNIGFILLIGGFI